MPNFIIILILGKYMTAVYLNNTDSDLNKI